MSVLLKNVDLITVISDNLNPPERRQGVSGDRPWWLCPFHPDDNPSLTITPDGQHWICFACGKRGDAIDFLRERDPSLSFTQALEKLGLSSSCCDESRWSRRPRWPQKPVGPPLAKLRRPPSAAWQRHVRDLVRLGEARLWSHNGRKALDWLRKRGLQDRTIRQARLGYCPVDCQPILSKGILIPWFQGSKIRMLNVRRLAGHPKYQSAQGSVQGGWYPDASSLLAGRPAIIVEGEFDALLVNQECGVFIRAVTLGSAVARPSALDLAALATCDPLLIAYDNDEAGDEAAAYWRQLCPGRAMRVRPPVGKDITDVHLSGRSLRAWIRSELRRLKG